MLLSGCFSLHVVKCVKSVLCAGKKQQHDLQVLLFVQEMFSFVGFCAMPARSWKVNSCYLHVEQI